MSKYEAAMYWVNRPADILAAAAKGEPVTTTFVVGMFWLLFNVLEGMVEELIFGDKFLHWLDPVIGCFFIAYAALAVYRCAWYNTPKRSDAHGAE